MLSLMKINYPHNFCMSIPAVSTVNLTFDQNTITPSALIWLWFASTCKFLGPKVTGGLGVFVNEGFKDCVKLIPNTCNDSIWIWINDLKDIYLGTNYVSPRYFSAEDIDFLNTLNKEISQLNATGNVFVQGQLNARTINDPDFLQIGKHLDSSEKEMDDPEIDEDPNLRNSEDRTLKAREKNFENCANLISFLLPVAENQLTLLENLRIRCGKAQVWLIIYYNPLVGEFILRLSDHCIINPIRTGGGIMPPSPNTNFALMSEENMLRIWKFVTLTLKHLNTFSPILEEL